MPTHLLAHLSDLHLDGGPRAFARARRVMDHLNDLPAPVDAVLVTGDLTADGRPEEYAQVAELVATSRHPVFTCPGNHDSRAAYRQVLLGEVDGEATEPVNRVHRIGDLVVAMCDSTLPGEHGGRLTDDSLAWLEATLRDTPGRTPVVLAFHHPPVVLHTPVLDGMRQDGAERLAELVGRYPNVAAVLCGHAHTSASTTFAGRPLRVVAGVYSTLTLPWESGDLLDATQPPGLAFHVLDDGPDDGPDGAAARAGWRVVTHYRTLALAN